MKLDELSALNALWGFCVPTDGTWPEALYQLGYSVLGVEREISTRIAGSPKTKVLDFACGSETANHILCFEAKSRTITVDQAQTYAAVKTSDFVRQYWLTAGFTPSATSHDVGYIAGDDDAPSVTIGLEKIGVALPVVSASDSRFDLESGSFNNSGMQSLFIQGIPLGADHEWPRHFVKFNSRSSDSVVVGPVVAAVSKKLIDGDAFNVVEMCERAISHWAYCGRGEQTALRRKVGKIINQASREELTTFFARDGKKQAWLPLKGALLKHAQVNKLMRASQDFVKRVQLGVPYGDQPTLFEDIEDDYFD